MSLRPFKYTFYESIHGPLSNPPPQKKKKKKQQQKNKKNKKKTWNIFLKNSSQISMLFDIHHGINYP